MSANNSSTSSSVVDQLHIKRWPPEVMDALRKATAEVMADQAAKDADFKRVWEDMQAYVAQLLDHAVTSARASL